MTSRFVYLIGPDDGAPVCKIGIAVDPKKRLAQLQTGSHIRLRVFGAFECKNIEIARFREQKAHQLFADFRTTGEWFGLHAESVIGRISDWFCGEPVKLKRKHSLPDEEFKPFHPNIPDDLRGVPISQMQQSDRLRYWAAYELGPPPPGFDDWFIIGNKKHGVMGAYPVEGFVCQEPS